MLALKAVISVNWYEISQFGLTAGESSAGSMGEIFSESFRPLNFGFKRMGAMATLCFECLFCSSLLQSAARAFLESGWTCLLLPSTLCRG